MARLELGGWQRRARSIPDPVLRQQAMASLAHKRFHADGGCVYAAALPQGAARLVRLIVALQTISDYLDNLCDRCDILDPDDFTLLHTAMQDAVRPGAPLRPYYRLRGNLDDGGYLAQLVRTCQEELRQFPHYRDVFPYVAWFIDRYCELQVHKHVHPSERTVRLVRWWSTHRDQSPQVEWWEFAAATGSTLGVFALFLLAARSSTVSPQVLAEAYFPWICGLHILLDYWIDLDEDLAAGDFNFVRCYPSPAEAHLRLKEFARQSAAAAARLRPESRIHEFVVRGLLGMYLSDEKAARQPVVRPARRLVWQFGPEAWLFYTACKLYRRIR